MPLLMDLIWTVTVHNYEVAFVDVFRHGVLSHHGGLNGEAMGLPNPSPAEPRPHVVLSLPLDPKYRPD